MQPWLIVLVTLLSGGILFGIIFYFKNRKNKNQPAAVTNPVVMYTNSTAIPSTNRAPAYNIGTPPTMYQYSSVTANQVGFNPVVVPGYQGHPNTHHNQQFHTQMGQPIHSAYSTPHRSMAQPTAPTM